MTESLIVGVVEPIPTFPAAVMVRRFALTSLSMKARSPAALCEGTISHVARKEALVRWRRREPPLSDATCN